MVIFYTRPITLLWRSKATCIYNRLVIIILMLLSLLILKAPSVQAEEPGLDADLPMHLNIPAIALQTEIIPVEASIIKINNQLYLQWNTADNLVGWHNRSALPGEGGNTVLAGHSDVYSRIFQNLNLVNIGDEIIVNVASQKYRYLITQKIVVQETGASLAQRIENGKWIGQTGDERLTLITCANPGATHRLIVVAKPITENTPVCNGCLTPSQLLAQLLPYNYAQK